MENIDISLIVTFHSEGLLAHSTLNSIERCRLYAQDHNITTEYIWVFDKIDLETKKVLEAHPIDSSLVTIIEVTHGDSGAARNSGIALAKGNAIAIFDGDDYYSTNWIERAWYYLQKYGPKTILHPEFIMNFESIYLYGWQIDQSENSFDVNGLLTNNFWTSATLAYRSVHLEILYTATHVLKTGFAFEDWHWNCETIAAGYQHRLASKTIGFYRRKKVSRITQELCAGGIMAPAKLFAKNFGEAK